MRTSFIKRLLPRSSCSPRAHSLLPQCSRHRYQMQSQMVQQLLKRRDGTEMSTYDLETLFKNVGRILEEISKDPKGYRPSDVDATDELMSKLRLVRFEFAPSQLRFLSSNFMLWFHGYKAKTIYANLHRIAATYDVKSSEKKNEFTSFSAELLKWSTFLTEDMRIVWECLEHIDLDAVFNDGEFEDREEVEKIVRNLRVNSSLYLNNYNKYLLHSYDDIMEFSQRIAFLEYDEAQLTLTAAPFLGKFDVMSSLIDRLTEEKERETQKNPEILLDKVLDLPTGLNWFNLYCMYREGSKYKAMMQKWEEEQALFYQAHDRKTHVRNVNDICWFSMDSFQSQIVDVDVVGEHVNADELKQKYRDSEYQKQCDLITQNNSLLRKMGNTCQIICLLGSEQSIFGESLLHLTGLWLNNFANLNGDGDRIVVCGKNSIPFASEIGNENAYLVHEESWDLCQQYSLDKDTVFVAGMCDTEQRIQSFHGEKLSIPNVPTVVRLRTHIQMTLSKHC